MIGKERPNKRREFCPSTSGFRLETVLAYSNVSVFNLETELADSHMMDRSFGRLCSFASTAPFDTMMYVLDTASLQL
jgi:hypothetical protein